LKILFKDLWVLFFCLTLYKGIQIETCVNTNSQNIYLIFVTSALAFCFLTFHLIEK